MLFFSGKNTYRKRGKNNSSLLDNWIIYKNICALISHSSKSNNITDHFRFFFYQSYSTSFIFWSVCPSLHDITMKRMLKQIISCVF